MGLSVALVDAFNKKKNKKLNHNNNNRKRQLRTRHSNPFVGLAVDMVGMSDPCQGFGDVCFAPLSTPNLNQTRGPTQALLRIFELQHKMLQSSAPFGSSPRMFWLELRDFKLGYAHTRKRIFKFRLSTCCLSR